MDFLFVPATLDQRFDHRGPQRVCGDAGLTCAASRPAVRDRLRGGACPDARARQDRPQPPHLVGSRLAVLRALAVAGALALTHVGSAVVLALAAAPILTRTLGGVGRAPVLEDIRPRVMLCAWSGLWFLFRALRGRTQEHREGIAVGIVAGLVPCPLTLFARSRGLSRGIPEAGLTFAAGHDAGVGLDAWRWERRSRSSPGEAVVTFAPVGTAGRSRNTSWLSGRLDRLGSDRNRLVGTLAALSLLSRYVRFGANTPSPASAPTRQARPWLGGLPPLPFPGTPRGRRSGRGGGCRRGGSGSCPPRGGGSGAAATPSGGLRPACVVSSASRAVRVTACPCAISARARRRRSTAGRGSRSTPPSPSCRRSSRTCPNRRQGPARLRRHRGVAPRRRGRSLRHHRHDGNVASS